MKPSIFVQALAMTALAGTAGAATLAHRYSYDPGSELVDSVGGNTGVLVNSATVSGGQLRLDGAGTGPGASSMQFSSTVDIGGNFGATGVTIETWYTDDGTGTWGKLFTFGTSSAGQEIAWTNFRGGGDLAPGLDRNGAHGITTHPFGSNTRLATGVEHHLALTIASDGTTNMWIDGVQEISGLATNPLSNVVTNTESIGSTAWGDPGHLGSVNEFRIYSGELTPQEIALNGTLGPDTLVPEPAGATLIAVSGFLLLLRRRRSI